MPETAKYLTKAEVRKFFSVIRTTRDRALYHVLYFHGLRASEVGRLQMVDFVERRLLIRRRKGSLPSNPELSPATLRHLTAWLKERGPAPGAIFLSNRKRGISRAQVHVLTRKYAALAGIPIEKAHAHIFKHSLATHLLQSGSKLIEVQKILGHKKITSTQEYLHMADSEVDAAARKFSEEW